MPATPQKWPVPGRYIPDRPQLELELISATIVHNVQRRILQTETQPLPKGLQALVKGRSASNPSSKDHSFDDM
jgi:hypothetical protein